MGNQPIIGDLSAEMNQLDNERQADNYKADLAQYGVQEIKSDFSGNEKKKDLDSMSASSFNTSCAEQPKETDSSEKKDFAQTVTAFRTPTKDTDNPPLS